MRLPSSRGLPSVSARVTTSRAPPPPRRSPFPPQSWEARPLCLPKSPRGPSWAGVGWGEGHITKTRKNKLDNKKNYSNCFHFPRAARRILPAAPPAVRLSGILSLAHPVPSPRLLLSSPFASAFPSLPPFSRCAGTFSGI